MNNKPIETGVIHIWDLPEDLVYVGLNKDFEKNMIRNLKCSHQYLINVSRALNKHEQMLYNIGRNRKLRLDFLWKISDMLIKKRYEQYSKENIEKNIEVLGTKRGNVYIHKPKLPFNFNSEDGAHFISAILFDGGIDREMKPHYGNIHFFMRNRIKNSAVALFGSMHHKELNPKRSFFIRFPRVIGILLNHNFNIVAGAKVYTNNGIPKFVFNYPPKLKQIFIKQAFDDDGSVSPDKRTIQISGAINVNKKLYNIRTKGCDMNLMNGLKILLHDIEIEPNEIRLDKKYILKTDHRIKGPFFRHVWKLSITGIVNLEAYYRKVGFNLLYKQNRLKKLISSYESKQRRKMEIYDDVMKVCLELQKRNGCFTAKELVKEMNITYRYAARIMQKMQERKLIKIKLKRKHHGLGGGSESASYVIVKR